MLSFLRPDPPAPALTDPAAIGASFKHWRRRVLLCTIVGYGIFYFVRKNLSPAMPVMERDLGISKESLGLFLTLHGLLYGLSKFIHGYIGDRSNARTLMVCGIIGSAVLNVVFGLVPVFVGTSAVALGTVWMLNGWFQGMGFPPCARLMTNWFAPKELAMKMAIQNTSHQLGGGMIVVLASYLVTWDWRFAFFVPAVIAIACAFFLSKSTPDTPPSVGLPEVEGTHEESGAQTAAEFRATVIKRVFLSPWVWLVSFANFFVYVLRYGVFDWGPTLITQTKSISITGAGWMLMGFEWSGLAGALVAGWLADRFFGGRAMRVGVIYIALAGASIAVLWHAQAHWLITLLLCSTGFFIYGPQCLVATAAANLATKRAAATAIGLTGIFGYGSTILSGWGLGWLAHHYGWDAGFKCLLIVAGLGVVVFALCWPARAHSYNEPEPLTEPEASRKTALATAPVKVNESEF